MQMFLRKPDKKKPHFKMALDLGYGSFAMPFLNDQIHP
jgi:hypothetical protein